MGAASAAGFWHSPNVGLKSTAAATSRSAFSRPTRAPARFTNGTATPSSCCAWRKALVRRKHRPGFPTVKLLVYAARRLRSEAGFPRKSEADEVRDGRLAGPGTAN